MPVKGVPELIRKLKRMDETIQKEVKEEIFDTGQAIAAQATSNAARSFNVGSESIAGGFGVRIFVDKGNLAAYREFGTGLSAAQYVPTLPKEWQSMAMLFYVNGKGKLQKQPFLYPAYFKNVPILRNNLNEILKRVTKR